MGVNIGCGFPHGEENVNQIDSLSVETESTVPPETRRAACPRGECPCPTVEEEMEDQYVCANEEEEMIEMVPAVHRLHVERLESR
jgi:hypothetical protein